MKDGRRGTLKAWNEDNKVECIYKSPEDHTINKAQNRYFILIREWHVYMPTQLFRSNVDSCHLLSRMHQDNQSYCCPLPAFCKQHELQGKWQSETSRLQPNILQWTSM